jgi:hypothetical protein
MSHAGLWGGIIPNCSVNGELRSDDYSDKTIQPLYSHAQAPMVVRPVLWHLLYCQHYSALCVCNNVAHPLLYVRHQGGQSVPHVLGVAYSDPEPMVRAGGLARSQVS